MKFRALLPLFVAALTAQAAPKSRPAPAPRGPATPAPFSLPATTAAPTPQPGKLLTADLGGRDLRFLGDALEHGLAQVYLTDVAKAKGASDQVKGFAGVLADTQKQENEKLARLAEMKGVTLGARQAAAQKALADRFEVLAGPKFEKAWFEEIIALNQQVIANYEIGAQSTDLEIKGFAEKALPLAREKLILANKFTGNAPTKGSGIEFRSTPTPVPPPR